MNEHPWNRIALHTGLLLLTVMLMSGLSGAATSDIEHLAMEGLPFAIQSGFSPSDFTVMTEPVSDDIANATGADTYLIMDPHLGTYVLNETPGRTADPIHANDSIVHSIIVLPTPTILWTTDDLDSVIRPVSKEAAYHNATPTQDTQESQSPERDDQTQGLAVTDDDADGMTLDPPTDQEMMDDASGDEPVIRGLLLAYNNGTSVEGGSLLPPETIDLALKQDEDLPSLPEGSIYTYQNLPIQMVGDARLAPVTLVRVNGSIIGSMEDIDAIVPTSPGSFDLDLVAFGRVLGSYHVTVVDRPPVLAYSTLLSSPTNETCTLTIELDSADVDGTTPTHEVLWSTGGSPVQTNLTTVSRTFTLPVNITVTITAIDNSGQRSSSPPIEYVIPLENLTNATITDSDYLNDDGTQFGGGSSAEADDVAAAEGAMVQFPTAGLLTGSVLAGLLMYILLTENGTYLAYQLIMPMYTKLKRKDVMNNALRERIYGYILGNPGEHYRRIKNTLSVPNGQLIYHLKVLEREEFISSVESGGYRSYYPADMRIPRQAKMMTSLHRMIYSFVFENPGESQRTIADKLGVSPSTLNENIARLVEKNLLRLERSGRKTLVYINEDSHEAEQVHMAIDIMGGGPSDDEGEQAS